MNATKLLEKTTTAIQAGFLSHTARSVRREHLTYLSVPKLLHLEKTLRQIEERQIPGDFLEFGIALGGSAVLIAKSANKLGRSFTGFDVFGMIPPPLSEKDDVKSKERYKAIVNGQSQGLGNDVYYGYRQDLYAEVVQTFSRYGLKVGKDGLGLEKGLFQDTWPRWKQRPVAFVHIDCDWFDPVRYCLDQVCNLVVRAGVILLDDYHDYGGAQLATDEFLSKHRNFTFEDGANVLLRARDSN